MPDKETDTNDNNTIDVFTVLLNILKVRYYILFFMFLTFILSFMYNQNYSTFFANVNLSISPSNETPLKIGKYDYQLLVSDGFTKEYLTDLYISKIYDKSLLINNIDNSDIKLEETNKKILESVTKGSFDYTNKELQFVINENDFELFKNILEVHLEGAQTSLKSDILDYYNILSESIMRQINNLRINHEFNINRRLELIEHKKESKLLSSENEIDDIIFFVEANRDLAIRLGYENPLLNLIDDEFLDKFYNVEGNNSALVEGNNSALFSDSDRFNLLKRFTALSLSDTPLYFFGSNILNAELDHIIKNKEFLINSSVNEYDMDVKLINQTLNDTFIKEIPSLNQELTQIETLRITLEKNLFNDLKYNFIKYDLNDISFNRIGISSTNIYLLSILIGGLLGLIVGLFKQEFTKRKLLNTI